MKNILIANIGNRNILYKNQLIDNKVFRAETERIWQNFEIEKEHLVIQIIPHHIDSETESIVLISTNQENLDYNQQDTIFEGKILKKLLETNYHLPVEVETFAGNPTDENQIFPFYSALIRKIISRKNDNLLVFNDAGGTPQMKLVVKELLDFYLTNNRFKIVYSDQKDEKRVIERIYKNKYILLKTAKNFVDEFNYNAALKIIEQVPTTAGINENLKKLILLASKRLNFQIDEVRNQLKDDEQFQNRYKLVFNHLRHRIPPDIAIQFHQLKKEFQLEIFELSSICQLYFKISNYTLAIATYYRLTEEFFHRFVHSYGKYKLSDKKERDRFIIENFKDMEQWYKPFQTYEPLKPNYGLTTLCLYTFANGDVEIKKIAGLFMKTISMFRQNSREGIDILRNQCFLAHKNNSVTIEMINKTEPKFLNQILPEIFKSLKMPEENIYFSLNRIILKEFLNN